MSDLRLTGRPEHCPRRHDYPPINAIGPNPTDCLYYAKDAKAVPAPDGRKLPPGAAGHYSRDIWPGFASLYVRIQGKRATFGPALSRTINHGTSMLGSNLTIAGFDDEILAAIEEG